MITSAPGAPLGTLTHLPAYSPSTFPEGSAILCRNTAPLITMCYGLLSRHVPCRIAGKEIGEQLVAIIKRLRAGNVPELLIRIAERERGASARSIERVSDETAALTSLCKDAETVEDVVSRIRRVFSSAGPSSVLLSTIHKAKGGEWQDVFLLDFHLLPSKYACTQEQLQQEKNLQYVAVTRSLANLTFIQSNQWKTDTCGKEVAE